MAQTVKPLPTETWVQSLGQEDVLEKEMATHSIIIAWKIPWMKKPGKLQSMGLQGVEHDRVTSLSLSFKEVKDLYLKNYKTLMKEIEDVTNR